MDYRVMLAGKETETLGGLMAKSKIHPSERRSVVILVTRSPIRVFRVGNPEEEAELPVGTHQMQRIPNPLDPSRGNGLYPWLVLPKQGIGMSEEAFRTSGSVISVGEPQQP